MTVTLYQLTQLNDSSEVGTVTNFTNLYISSDEKGESPKEFISKHKVVNYKEIVMKTETQDWYVKELEDGKMYIKEGEEYVEIDNTNPLYYEKLSLTACDSFSTIQKIAILLYKWDSKL